MAGLPVRYRKGGVASASYDWVDFISGAGYRRFYGTCQVTGAFVHGYFLNNREMDSATGESAAISAVWTVAAAGADIDIDFDITFIKPAYIGAVDAFVNVSHLVSAPGHGKITVTIYHVTSGGVETQLGRTVGSNEDAVPDGYFRECFKVALTGHTFGVGEKLRVSILDANDTADGTNKVYHDPTSALTLTDIAGRTVGTDLTVDVPFKIDI